MDSYVKPEWQYLCTLQVFDPTVVETLAPWIVGDGPLPKELRGERPRPDRDELIEWIEEADGGDREEYQDVALYLAELAMKMSAKRRPFATSRGFAIGIIDDKEDDWANAVAKTLKERFAGEVDPVFAPVYQHWPHLKGCFDFDNQRTGVFIPAGQVSAAHAWLLEALAADAPARHASKLLANVKALSDILGQAAAAGLPYWEGHDLLPAPKDT